MAPTSPQPALSAGPGTGRALVVGAGIGGLLAAAALTRSFREVLVLEQDAAAGERGTGSRPGLPQEQHLHVLLRGGSQAISEVLPDLEAALAKAGAPPVDTGDGMFLCTGKRTAERWLMNLHTYAISRFGLETCVRGQALALPGVRVLNGIRVTGPHTLDGRTVTGVTIEDPSETHGTVRSDGRRVLDADLVVDASGRSSRADRWLPGLGAPAPRTEVIDGGLGYVTVWLDEPGPLTPERPILYDVGSIPVNGRGVVAMRTEDGRTVLAAFGRGEDRPPMDHDGYLGFLRSLGNPLIDQLATGLHPGQQLHRYARLPNRRHRYALRSWPPGLLVLGDALCMFNPVYGQGMTVAARQARVLGRHAARLARDPASTRRTQRRIVRQSVDAWLVSTAQDASWTSRPPWYTVPVAWLLNRTLVRSVSDRRVHRALLETVHMVSSTALLRPRVLAALLRPARRPPA